MSLSVVAVMIQVSGPAGIFLEVQKCEPLPPCLQVGEFELTLLSQGCWLVWLFILTLGMAASWFGLWDWPMEVNLFLPPPNQSSENSILLLLLKQEV